MWIKLNHWSIHFQFNFPFDLCASLAFLISVIICNIMFYCFFLSKLQGIKGLPPTKEQGWQKPSLKKKTRDFFMGFIVF